MKSYLVPHNISQQKMSSSKTNSHSIRTNSHSIRMICMQPCAAPIRSSQPPRCGPLHQNDTAVCPHHCSAGPGLHKLLGLFSKRAQIWDCFPHEIATVLRLLLVVTSYSGYEVATTWRRLRRGLAQSVERTQSYIERGKRKLGEKNLTLVAGSGI